VRSVSAKICSFSLAVIALGFLAQPADAGYLVTFSNKTNNSNVNVASQLQLTIQDRTDTTATNDVRFVFRNVGSIGSIIDEIYYDDGSLMNPQTAGYNFTGSGSGVSFRVGSNNPSHPPGITSFNSSLLLDAESAGNANTGINNAAANSTTEFLYFNFTLSNNQTYADVIHSLQTASQNWNQDITGGLRIALHVHGIAGAGANDSDSFLSTGFQHDGNNSTGAVVTAVPAPTGVVLIASALPFLGLRRLIRRKTPAAA
jgi:hypothetical protein